VSELGGNNPVLGNMRACAHCGAVNCGGSCPGAQRAEVDGWRQRAERAEERLRRSGPQVDSAEFIDLCAKLRGLGATKVTLGVCSAEFTPVSGSAVVPTVAGGRSRQEERSPSPEEANEARRRRELG
jgi:hypothetical protein